MYSKKLLIILLLNCFSYLNAQENPASTKNVPGNTNTQQKYSGATIQNLVLDLQHDTCLDKKFSIIFHLINDSAFKLTSPTTSLAAIGAYNLTAVMSILNTAFKPICVQFENCKIDIIPDYTFNSWKPNGNGAEVIKNYYEKYVINVYLPDEILPPLYDAPEASYTFPLPPIPQGAYTTTDAIVIPKVMTTQAMHVGAFAGSYLLHVFGHYFGLPHTYFEKTPGSVPSPPPPSNASPPINSLEYVDHANIQNCLDHGDGFCDTEADPYPANPSSNPYPVTQAANCGDVGGLKDGHGDFYILPSDNFMSHYGCRCKYSPQQYRYMAYMIMTRRLYLH